MTMLTRQVKYFICHYPNSNCFNCGDDLLGQKTIGKRGKKRYCLFCAFIKKIITVDQAREFSIPIPTEEFIEAFHSKKITKAQLVDLEIEVLQVA